MEAYTLPELYGYLLKFHKKLVTEKGEYKATCVIDIKQFLDFIETSAQKGVELARRRNTIFSSFFKTFEKLKKLGFIYYNGQVVFLEEKEESYG